MPDICTPEHRLCKDAASEECRAPSPNGSCFCTRSRGHAGPHVACGLLTHNLITWPNEPRKPVMVKQTLTIEDRPPRTLVRPCEVRFECDGETAALALPQFDREDDNMTPSVYLEISHGAVHAHLVGGPDDEEWDFVWNEVDRRWKLERSPETSHA